MQSPRYVVADIGGTNARFACTSSAQGPMDEVQVFPCANFPFLLDAIETYIASLPEGTIAGICLAVAGPVDTDPIDLPNNHWTFSRLDLEQSLGVPVNIINDFSAQVLSIDTLDSTELHWLGPARPSASGVTAVIGAGTGLGVSALMPSGDILPSEAGHVGFAPVDQHQSDLLQVLRKRYQRVSAERILSGSGLANLYWANCHLQGQCRELPAAEITAGAQANDPLCRKAVDDFLAILAAFAGDVALMTGANQGVYLSGGILPRLLEFLDEELFLRHFRAKGRFHDFNTAIPLAAVLAEQPGLRGCARALALT
jgi:glucokinase